MGFLLNRLGQTLLVVLVAGLVSFALFRYVGDPVNNMVGQAATLEQRQAMRTELGLTDPVPVQFLRYEAAALRGEFGVSFRFSQPVLDLLRERFPATLELTAAAMLIAIATGVPLGVWTALHRRSWVSKALMAVSLVGVALPTFVIGIVLILLFSVWLGWLPSFGRNGLTSLILPSITLGIFQMTLIMRVVRAEMLEVMRTDYIRFADARGLRRGTIVYRHALRNTLLPVVTLIGLQFGNVFAFSIIVETVFQWPGLGLLVIQAIQFGDIPLLAGYLSLVALGFALINLTVDLLYLAIDPRLRSA